MNEIVINRDVFEAIYLRALECADRKGLSDFNDGWSAGYLYALDNIRELFADD